MEKGKDPRQVTRRHIIRRIGNSRIFHIIGGKITTSRNLAEQTGDRVSLALAALESDPKQRLQALKARFNCKTRTEPLPGGRGISDLETYKRTHVPQATQRYDVPEAVVEELINRYGSLYTEVLDLTREDPSLTAPLTSAAPMITAQVLHAIRYENAETLMDVFTESLKMDLLPDGGLDGLEAAVDILAREKQLTNQEKMLEVEAYREYLHHNMSWRQDLHRMP
jgi:glycerol-3-phosphate dehydrogenase